MLRSGLLVMVPEARSRNMAAIRSKNTKPELLVRSLVHQLGYRFRLHASDLPGRPDVIFRPKKKAIFVHGCFWHQHSKKSCSDSTRPKSNSSYWNAKLELNIERDKHHLKALRKLGWSCLVVWDCETPDTAQLERRIRHFLG